jgi:hypothetical protein
MSRSSRKPSLRRNTVVLVVTAALGLAPAWVAAEEAPLSPKQLNDPLPPSAMPRPEGPDVVTPRGTPEGMGNEVDLSKTPGDDDPSDGIDEPGRNPEPGLPREAPGVNKP